MNKLQYMRKERGFTQKELAERSGVNIRQIQHFEQGTHNINGASVVTVLCLAEALECDVYDIINPRTEIECPPIIIHKKEGFVETEETKDSIVIKLGKRP